MHRRATRSRTALPAAVLAVVSVVPAACTYAEEPGLFRRPAPTVASLPPSGPADASDRPRAAGVELPVAGDAIWTSSEGLRLTSRLAVHAVRRIPGGAVLDFSVTPLAAPGMQDGQQIPSSVDFGLGVQTGGDVTALLLDAAAGRVYRPLQHRSRRQFQHCLCTPPWVARLDLRLGETRLLQVAFPALPARARTVDVSLGTVPVFSRVPVTPVGEIPTAATPTDLHRPAEDQAPLAPPVTVTDDDPGPVRLQSLLVEAIEVGPDTTSVRWTLRTLTTTEGAAPYPSGPPLNAPPRSEEPPPWRVSTASGPLLQAGSTTLAPLRYTYTTPDRTYRDCVCTGFGPWATTLRQAGGSASVTTVYPRLPAGTERVDVVLPGTTTIWRLPVTPSFDGSARSGRPRAERVQSWRYRIDAPPGGWPADRWPTPLPDPAQVGDYDAFVERLLPSSSR